MINKILFLLILASTLSYADDVWVLDSGVGILGSAKKGLSETKMVTFGKQMDLWGPLKERGIVGGFIDNGGSGRKGSPMVSGQLGFEVENRGWVGSVYSGPALLGQTDVMLGGHLQFMDDLHLGLRDRENNYIGIIYRHVSSASVSTPNLGRDFLGIELTF